ncbi:pseudouridine synthase [Alicycliphilus sp. T452]
MPDTPSRNRPPATPTSSAAPRTRLVLRRPDPAAKAPPAARPAPARAPVARPPAAADGRMRLNKRMADLGLCSRREADDWIAQGWVRVNGQVAVMGLQVGPQDRIEVDRAAQGRQSQQVTILLHKPMGYVSGQAEDGHTPAVALINARSHWQGDASRTRFAPAQLKGLAPCGRLDIDSVGLLVLTQDGRVARQLIGEDSAVDKEYLVRVQYGERTQDVRAVFPADKLALLGHGLLLDGQPLRPALVDWQNPEQLRFVLREGKKRQIRRMCELVGLKVVGLKRIRIGRVLLGNLPVGQWRYLAPGERF